MKILKKYAFTWVLILSSLYVNAQEITISNVTSEAIITKSTVQVPAIPTGEPFNYKITFQNLNQSNLLSITDVLPTGLCYTASDIVADPTFIDFSGNVIPNPNSIPGLVDTSGLPTVNFVIPNNVQRGSFTITVTFCGGTTPNGFTVTNNICAIYGPGGSNDESFCSTVGITSTAEAINPWGVITKEPLFPAILGSNGEYYIPTTGGVSNYKIRIEKDPQYAGSVFGMLNLTNVTISEMFMPCATVSLISGPGTLNTSTGTITLSNDLQGNVPFEYAEFIVNVDYSTCGTLSDGQIINNTVDLNGQAIGEGMQNNISSDTANVTAVDNLPPPNDSSSIVKMVEVSNPVPGCLGTYTITFVNTDNRPISFTEISDILPNNVIPQSIQILGIINSASITDSFDIVINNGTPTPFSLATGYNGNPWAASSNSFLLTAHANTELYPGDIIELRIPFVIDSNNPVGSLIDNCTDMEGFIIDPANNINLPLISTSCASFNIESPQVKLCATKGVRRANTSDPFSTSVTNIVPTDELEFQICVQNNGSMDFNGQLEDVLDAKYDFVSVVSSTLPSGTTFNQNGQTLTWNNINLFQNCNSFSGIYGCLNYANQDYCVVVKVRVKPLTAPGNIDNNATLSGNNTAPLTTDFAKVNVIQSSVLKLEQEISIDNVTYTETIQLNPICDDLIFYKLKVTNLGNIPVSQHQIINEFPQINDIYYPTSLQRNSTFSYDFLEDSNSPDYNVSYLNVVPSLGVAPANYDCNTAPSGNTTPSNNDITLVYDSTAPLTPGGSNTIIIEAKIFDAYTLTSNDLAVNSAYFVDCGTSNGSIIIPSNQTTVDIETPLDICYELDLEPYANAVPDLFSSSLQQELTLGTPNGMRDKEYGDIDNDFDIDIIYTKNNYELHVVENTAGPGVTPVYNVPGNSLNITNYAYSFRLIDWDNNGWNDLVVFDSNQAQTSFHISLYFNNGNGTFPATPSAILLQANVHFPLSEILIDLGDLNGDDLPDLLMSGQGGVFGTAYFENTGGSSPYFILAPPQSYVPGDSVINNIFIDEVFDSLPSPEIYDADCDGDNDIFISDPLYGAPNWGGGRMYFHENNGNLTNGTIPDINVIGITEQYGFVEILNDDLRCDWVITRFVDYFNNGCPIAISFNPCNDMFFYYDSICYTCPGEVLGIDDQQDVFDKNDIYIYPNPSNTFISIENGSDSEIDVVEIYSITGKLVSRVSYNNQPLDVSYFSNGLYLIKIISGETSVIKKMIKN